MNVNNVLRYSGFRNGIFNAGADPVGMLDVNAHQSFGSVEGTNGFVDTPEEFITAAYYSPVEVSAGARAAINRELPQGREGALRLGAMWLKKGAELPHNAAAYQRALGMIMQRSGVSAQEIRDYYVRTMTETIHAAGQRFLGRYYTREQLVNTVCRPIVEYYSNPTTSNYTRLVQMGGTISRENSTRGASFLTVIQILDPLIEFDTRLTQDIYNYGRQVSVSAPGQ
jgi:hypothetical protein